MNSFDLNLKEIMHRQPIINVGTTGHVANGKSTLVKCITSKATQQFAKEKERNITIRLGYANAKIWCCPNCPVPQGYSASDSSVMINKCSRCDSQLDLVNHISIVDCPGHNELTSTMLNGSSVMDYAILVESCSNESIPALQTAEHFTATQAAGIPTVMIIMNKIDLVKKEKAKEQITKIKQYVEQTGTKTGQITPVIPISATFGSNVDVVCHCLSLLKVPSSVRDPNLSFKMIVIRSFDINKPGMDITKLHGGVIGGTIMRGILRKGDSISIYPGMVREIPENEKKSKGADFRYEPIIGEVLSIKSDMNELDYAIPGGLLGIQLTIDPAFTKGDMLSGSLVIKTTDTSKVRVYDKIMVCLTNFLIDQNSVSLLLKTKPRLLININSNNINCSVHYFERKTKCLCLKLDQPIAIDSTDNIATIINTGNKDILARGMVTEGIECEPL